METSSTDCRCNPFFSHSRRATRQRGGAEPPQQTRSVAEQPEQHDEDDHETKAVQDQLHAGAAQRAGETLRRDALPRRVHARGAESEARPQRSPSAGEH